MLAAAGPAWAANPALPLVIYGSASYQGDGPVASGTVQAFLGGQANGQSATISAGSFGSVGVGGAPSVIVVGSTSSPDDTGQPVSLAVNGVVANVSVQGCTDATGAAVSPTPSALTWQSGWVCQVALTVPQGAAALAVVTGSLPAATVGVAYAATLTASGGTPPYSWSVVSGALPPGLTLDGTAGTIGGTPTQPGTSSFTVQVRDNAAATVTANLSITVAAAPAPLRVTTQSLPGATAGTSYSAQLQASGGSPPYRWSLLQGSLPAGLSLSAAGAISGVPATAGLDAFTVQVTDSGTPSPAVATLPLVLVVANSGVSVAGTATANITSAPAATQPATLAVTQGGSTLTQVAVVGLTGTVNVADYSANPEPTAGSSGVAFSAATGAFFDVSVVGGAGLSAPGASLVVTQCAGAAAGENLYWFNGTAWMAVSPPATYGTPVAGCLSATLNDSSSPSLSQLAGTPFAVGTAASLGGGGGGGGGAGVSLAPVVSGVSPTSGPLSGGTTVTITGSRLTGATGVSFGGVAASAFTVDSDGQITAISPPGTGTVDVTVTTAYGTSATSAADRFSYGLPASQTLPAAPTFSDVPTSFWSYGAIEALVAAQVVSGFPDGTFRPNQAVSRAEFAKMLALTLGLKPGGGAAPFADVPATAWFAPYVAAAAQAGIVQGVSPTAFDPDATLTREQLAVLLARALKQTQTATLHFTDDAMIDGWALQGVEEAVAAGYINGFPDGSFRPLATATRAQAAKVLAMVLQQAAR